MSIIVTTPQLSTNGNIAHSNVNNIVGAIEAGRKNEFVSNTTDTTMITKANKVITRVDSYSDVVVLSTVAATDNDDNTRTYNVTVKVTGNDEVSATATGTVTVDK